MYFTEEELKIAKSADLCDIASKAGYTVVGVGRTHSLKEYDSIRIYNRNTWYRWSDKTGGTTIDFLMHFCDMNFREAVEALLGEQGYHRTGEYQKSRESSVLQKNKYHPGKQAEQKTEADVSKEFILPEKNPSFRRVYAYLLQKRFISRDILNYFVQTGAIYEEKEHHNIVFLGRDREGNPRHASTKGTMTMGQSYRGIVEGSDSRYGLSYAGSGDTLYVFEASIDLLSFLTLYPKGWQEQSYVVLNGVSEHAMLQMLKDFPQIQHVVLCVDHDNAGIEADFRLSEILNNNGYKVSYLQSKNKDWNEDLKEKNGVVPIPAQEHPKMEEFKKWMEGVMEVAELIQNKGLDVAELKSKYGKRLDEAWRKGDLTEKSDDGKINDLEINILNLTSSVICEIKKYCEDFGRPFSTRQVAEQIYRMYQPHKDKGTLDSRLKEIVKNGQREKTEGDGLQEKKAELGRLAELALNCTRLHLYVEIDVLPLREKEKKEKVSAKDPDIKQKQYRPKRAAMR